MLVLTLETHILAPGQASSVSPQLGTHVAR